MCYCNIKYNFSTFYYMSCNILLIKGNIIYWKKLKIYSLNIKHPKIPTKSKLLKTKVTTKSKYILLLTTSQLNKIIKMYVLHLYML